jgi:hypothetical protein
MKWHAVWLYIGGSPQQLTNGAGDGGWRGPSFKDDRLRAIVNAVAAVNPDVYIELEGGGPRDADGLDRHAWSRVIRPIAEEQSPQVPEPETVEL